MIYYQIQSCKWVNHFFLLPSTASESKSTPRRGDLAPPLEEDEEQDSESQRGAPLRQIENNISALLRGDIPIARVAGELPNFSL